MKVNIRVKFDREDVKAAMLEKYVAKFGQAPEGFELVATEQYGGVEVEAIEKEAPAPPPQALPPVASEEEVTA